MEEIPGKLPPLIPEIYAWLQQYNIEPAGPVFFNYLDMQGDKLNAEVGVPVQSYHSGDNRVKPGTFPAGNYTVFTHMGNYSEIPQAHLKLEQWAKEKGIKLQNPCIEFYPTDPETLPNPADWQTDILRRVKEVAR
jgi:effector-binding domain-containing protein